MFDGLRKATESSKRFVDELGKGKCSQCDQGVNYLCEFCVGLSIMEEMNHEVPKLLAAFDALVEKVRAVVEPSKNSPVVTWMEDGSPKITGGDGIDEFNKAWNELESAIAAILKPKGENNG